MVEHRLDHVRLSRDLRCGLWRDQTHSSVDPTGPILFWIL